MRRTCSFVSLLIFAMALCCAAQTDAPPAIYTLRASIAKCRSVSCLKSIRATSEPRNQLTELVFQARWLMLSPRSSSAARGLLEAAPSNGEDQEQLTQVMDTPEGMTYSKASTTALAAIYDHWPELMARAVQLAPDLMKNYVAYLVLAPHDIHSNFTGEAKGVCKKWPRQFRSAFSELSEKDRKYIREYSFDPDHCKAIFVSEAD